MPGGLALGGEAPRTLGLVHRSSTGLGKTKTPLLKGAHRLLCALGRKVKQRLHSNLGQTCLKILKDLLGKQVVTVACFAGRALGPKV